ncbi:MAG: hypothetical protein HUK08_09470 [Bacteroidaceae bacterium]|nr:hypothetical protein [Bacteroidaceae bacterium]
MKSIIFLIIFAAGLIMNVYKRYKFEKTKQSHSAEYISLYREHNTMMIIIFAALTIINAMRVIGIGEY